MDAYHLMLRRRFPVEIESLTGSTSSILILVSFPNRIGRSSQIMEEAMIASENTDSFHLFSAIVIRFVFNGRMEVGLVNFGLSVCGDGV